MKLSAVINTKNAASTLIGCLQSVKFADEIIVVDMNSADETVAVAKKFTSKIYQHEDVGYVEPARNFAISKASGDWILVVDADEEIPPTLATKLRQIIKQDPPTDVFLLPRKNIIFQRWINKTGWWPDYQPRFFRKGAVSWKTELHCEPDTSGIVESLPANEKLAILHHNYRHLDQYITRLNQYTSLQAKEIESKTSDKEQINSSLVIDKLFSDFLRRFFLQGGASDGLHGTSLSLLQAFYELVIVLKRWELQGFPQTQEKTVDTMQSLSKVSSDLRYWIADWQVNHNSGRRRIFWQIRRKFRF